MRKMGLSRLLVAIFVAGGVALCPLQGFATTVPFEDLATLVDEADLIFVGSVVHAESVATGDGAFAFTLVTLRVDETLKGATRDSDLTLRFAGGEVGEDVFEVPGVPRFEPGGRHLLFVVGNRRLGCPLVGWFQGKLDLVPHPLTGETIAADFRGEPVAGISGRHWVHAGRALTPDGMLETPRDPGVIVLEEDGVEIEITDVSEPDPPADLVVPSREVLEALHAFVTQRARTPTYRAPPPFVESATAEDVPASFQFRAYPAVAR
jgi:hypothetical protein